MPAAIRSVIRSRRRFQSGPAAVASSLAMSGGSSVGLADRPVGRRARLWPGRRTAPGRRPARTSRGRTRRCGSGPGAGPRACPRRGRGPAPSRTVLAPRRATLPQPLRTTWPPFGTVVGTVRRPTLCRAVAGRPVPVRRPCATRRAARSRRRSRPCDDPGSPDAGSSSPRPADGAGAGGGPEPAGPAGVPTRTSGAGPARWPLPNRRASRPSRRGRAPVPPEPAARNRLPGSRRIRPSRIACRSRPTVASGPARRATRAGSGDRPRELRGRGEPEGVLGAIAQVYLRRRDRRARRRSSGRRPAPDRGPA